MGWGRDLVGAGFFVLPLLQIEAGRSLETGGPGGEKL